MLIVLLPAEYGDAGEGWEVVGLWFQAYRDETIPQLREVVALACIAIKV